MLQQTKTIAAQLYRHSFVRYLAIGVTSFAIDFVLLVLLHSSFGVNVILAATISYWTSVTFNFLANRFWTFEATEKNILEHLVAYLALLALNYLFTIAIILIGQHLGVHYTISKVVAVIIQMAWTYLVYKKIIFKAPAA